MRTESSLRPRGLLTRPDTVEVRGTPVWAGRRAEAARALRAIIDTGRRGYVCCAPVHLIELAHRDSAVGHALRGATIVLPDGAPVAWAARLLGGTQTDRVCGSDVFAALVFDPHLSYRHFFYGSTPTVLARLESEVRRAAPDVQIAGAFSPDFRPPNCAALADHANRINNSSPDVVWVGLGAPKQELWMAAMRDHLDAALLIGVGAVFDFVAGTKTRAPIAFQRAGLEWLHRLANEPRRLGPRYLTTNTSFVVGVSGSLIGRAARGISLEGA